MKSRRSVADAVHDAARRLDQAGVVFGHGTVDALQESTWLAAHVLRKSWNEVVAASQAPIDPAAEAAIGELVAQRIATRKPAAYLMNEAWLGPHRFYVDERVIVPRSFIAELLRTDRPPGLLFERPRSLPGSGPESGVRTILDLCTGSGCLAILAALACTRAQVDAADLSQDALDVARRNVDDYALGGRVRLVRSDLFAALGLRRYDLIISNPPYVKAAAMKRLPREYRGEPVMALASGADGLDHVRVILAQARRHLNPGGLLVVEVGHNRKALEKAFPGLPFAWPKTSGGRNFVFTLAAESLSPQDASPGESGAAGSNRGKQRGRRD